MSEYPINILVAVDGSYNSNRAFNHAVKLAQSTQGRLFVVRVVEDYYINEADGILQLINYTDDLRVINAKEDLNNKFMMTTYPITDTLLRIGDPKIIISSFLVPGLKIDYLIIGTIGSGYSGNKDIGSTAKYLTDHVSCNVLMIK